MPLSTGAYRFPMKRAAKIAVTETSKFLKSNDSLEEVIFVTFGQDAYD